MQKLRMAGLILVLLGLVLCFFIPIARDYHEFMLLSERRTSITLLTLGYASPIYLALALSFFWPRKGSLAAIILSFFMVLISFLAIVTSIDLSVFSSLSRASDILKELVFWVSPYLFSLTGSLLALISTRRIGTGVVSQKQIGATGMNKLRKAGLIMIYIAGMVQITYSVILGMLSGDSGLVANLFSGLVMGFIWGGPVLLIWMAALRTPMMGSILAAAASLGLLIFSIARTMNTPFNYDRTANLIVFFVSLIGCLIALAGSAKLSRQNLGHRFE